MLGRAQEIRQPVSDARVRQPESEARVELVVVRGVGRERGGVLGPTDEVMGRVPAQRIGEDEHVAEGALEHTLQQAEDLRKALGERAARLSQ